MANIEVRRNQTQPEQTGLARRGSSVFPSLISRDFLSISPFELMRQFTDQMDRAFENFGLWNWGRGGTFETETWSPAIEAFERGDNLVVRAELPGLNKDDVKVELTDDGLLIQGERKREHEEKGAGFYRSERSYGQFYRLIPLPEGANADQVRAQFNNGVLEVSVAVPESHKKRRTIPIEITSGEQSQTSQAKG